jgi:ribonuclease Y
MSLFTTLLVSALSAIGTGAGVYFVLNKQKQERENLDNSLLVEKAKAKAKEILVEAKENSLKVVSEAEAKARKELDKVKEKETKLEIERSKIDSKAKELSELENELKTKKSKISKKMEEADSYLKDQKGQLEKIASLTREEARKKLLSILDKELIDEKAVKVRQMLEDIKKSAETQAKEILLDAMRYGATDYVVEYTTSKVEMPEEDMKGKVIGKEGRNIRTFEEKTGVELDLDSSPGKVIISCFDPVRREIAKISLERLFKDGRIQPAKIEEIVEKTEKELDHVIEKAGEDLCHKVGAYNLPKEIVQHLGRFKYRFSYGQNMIEHTLEVTKMGMGIAKELKIDVETVKLGCLLHDIGKVITEKDGSHIELGVELLKKHNISEDVINCVAEHHEDRPFSSIESSVVQLADHISGARPGSRSEDYSSYIKRLKALEEAAMDFDGVKKVYALSAGRELRVFVDPEYVDDAGCALLAREIARKIELEQTYPGVVDVAVIRKTRFTGQAK